MSVNNTELFTKALNAYFTEFSTIHYCKNCDKPKLCMVCITSIGEATLIRFLARNQEFIVTHKILGITQ